MADRWPIRSRSGCVLKVVTSSCSYDGLYSAPMMCRVGLPAETTKRGPSPSPPRRNSPLEVLLGFCKKKKSPLRRARRSHDDPEVQSSGEVGRGRRYLLVCVCNHRHRRRRRAARDERRECHDKRLYFHFTVCHPRLSVVILLIPTQSPPAAARCCHRCVARAYTHTHKHARRRNNNTSQARTDERTFKNTKSRAAYSAVVITRH